MPEIFGVIWDNLVIWGVGLGLTALYLGAVFVAFYLIWLVFAFWPRKKKLK